MENVTNETVERVAQARIIEARMKLRERFLDRMTQTPAMSDERPLGSGPPNRHGMPQLPVGQHATAPGKWPVLDLGRQQSISVTEWELTVDGECHNPLRLDWESFSDLEQVEDASAAVVDECVVVQPSRLQVPGAMCKWDACTPICSQQRSRV